MEGELTADQGRLFQWFIANSDGKEMATNGLRSMWLVKFVVIVVRG